MQILGKRSRIMLIAAAIAMLTALGLSFALWDTNAVKAASADASQYANAKVGDVVTFGQYYQQANSADKTAIEWIVVDKDERTGQLTLMSKYILAQGSFFGNYYTNSENVWTSKYVDGGLTKDLNQLVGGWPFNQAWPDSTARAYLNNLERFDLGGDQFSAEGLLDVRMNSRILDLTDKDGQSMRTGELLASVGFSNAKYWTGLKTSDAGVDKLLTERPEEFIADDTEVYYRRARLTEPSQRLARNGFLDEAFTSEQRDMIVPRNIPGQISHRWPDNSSFIYQAQFVEGTTDKVWLPSAEELNIREAKDWNANPNDSHTNPTELESSTPLAYFKNFKKYHNTLEEALRTTCTPFAAQDNGLGNYSLPGWIPNEQIGRNSSAYYWTRSASTTWYNTVRFVKDNGYFSESYATCDNYVGIRPCLILQY